MVYLDFVQITSDSAELAPTYSSAYAADFVSAS